MKSDKAYLKHLLNNIAKLQDEKAFEILFKLFYDRLLIFSVHYVQSQQIAEEVISDVFMKLWHNRHNLADVENIETYLYIATKNQSLNYAQHLSAHKVSSLKETNLHELIDAFDPEKELELSELQYDLELAVDNLPLQCRLVFKLIKEDGFKYKEVAEILNLSVRTVETQLVRALKKLEIALASHRQSVSKTSKGSGTSILTPLFILFSLEMLKFFSRLVSNY